MAARTEQREFFVWVNPDDFMAKHNIGVVGGIGQEPPPQDFSPKDLLFIHNPNHKVGFVAPFHRGVIQDYGIEYDLERFRYENHRELPSRLFALYLFENRAEASKYHAQHPAHVGRRVLKRGITEGPYIYTVHDSAWIDFLRLPPPLTPIRLTSVGGDTGAARGWKDTNLHRWADHGSQFQLWKPYFMDA